MPAPASGVIEELLVEDGGRVVAGQEIFKLKLGGELSEACFTNQRRVIEINRIPTAQGKRGKWPKIPCLGEFGNFAKTQGTLFAQVVDSLILKGKNNL